MTITAIIVNNHNKSIKQNNFNNCNNQVAPAPRTSQFWIHNSKKCRRSNEQCPGSKYGPSWRTGRSYPFCRNAKTKQNQTSAELHYTKGAYMSISAFISASRLTSSVGCHRPISICFLRKGHTALSRTRKRKNLLIYVNNENNYHN